MFPLQSANSSPVPESLDELTRLELLVAKRADELGQRARGERSDREVWQQAEAEIWRQGNSAESAGAERSTSGSPRTSRGK